MTRTTARQKGAAELQRGLGFVRDRFLAGVDQLRLSRKSRLALRRLVLHPSAARELLASDLSARQKSGELLIRELLRFYKDGAQRHDHTFMGTFAWDVGVSKIDVPVIPIRALRGCIYKIMRRHQLEGVYLIETDIILALPGETCPRLHVHVHIACWHHDRPIKPKVLAKEIMETHKLSNALGARAVVFTKRRCTSANVACLGAYLGKVPATVKQRRPRRRQPGFKLTHEQAKYSNAMAVRMVEILSQLTLYEIIGGVGQGKAVTRAWRAKLYLWAKKRENHIASQSGRWPNGVVTMEEAQERWSKLRRRGLIKAGPVTVLR